MAQGTTAKQHYVPQFYLRQWIDEDLGFYPARVTHGFPPEIQIFERKSNPRSFCYENYFYAQHTGKADEMSQEIEKTFAEIEAIFSKELPAIEKKILNNEQIKDSDKYSLAQCMTFLHFRGKKYLDESKRMTNEMTQKMFEMRLRFSDNDPKFQALLKKHSLSKEELLEHLTTGRIEVDYGNHHHLQMLNEIQGFSNLLHAKFWRIYTSKEGHFITSDAPYNDRPLSREFYGNDFFSREQSFVLSPRAVIVAQSPKHEGGKKLVRNDLTGDKNKIGMINAHTLSSSIKFCFHKDQSILRHAALVVQALHQTHAEQTKKTKVRS